jgi:hypothetical protein
MVAPSVGRYKGRSWLERFVSPAVAGRRRFDRMPSRVSRARLVDHARVASCRLRGCRRHANRGARSLLIALAVGNSFVLHQPTRRRATRRRRLRRLGQIRHHIPGPVLRLERGSAGSEPSSSQIGGKTGGSQNRDGSCVPRRRRLRAPAFEIPAHLAPSPERGDRRAAGHFREVFSATASTSMPTADADGNATSFSTFVSHHSTHPAAR